MEKLLFLYRSFLICKMGHCSTHLPELFEYINCWKCTVSVQQYWGLLPLRYYLLLLMMTFSFLRTAQNKRPGGTQSTKNSFNTTFWLFDTELYLCVCVCALQTRQYWFFGIRLLWFYVVGSDKAAFQNLPIEFFRDCSCQEAHLWMLNPLMEPKPTHGC